MSLDTCDQYEVSYDRLPCDMCDQYWMKRVLWQRYSMLYRQVPSKEVWGKAQRCMRIKYEQGHHYHPHGSHKGINPNSSFQTYDRMLPPQSPSPTPNIPLSVMSACIRYNPVAEPVFQCVKRNTSAYNKYCDDETKRPVFSQEKDQTSTKHYSYKKQEVTK